ncbi:MAG: hypothetical protein C4576_06515 [Desulfobacteraceae bacterium]|nr:MAG: hypothetical protein C4576_06515 [Desulfobacteraceae bacterium]
MLPYLQSEEGRFSLGFTEESRSSSYPFVILSESSPFSRLIDARILSDAGSGLGHVSILLQRDRYSLPGQNELWPLNNMDIEQAWDQAFQRGGDLLLRLGSPTREGRLLPFRSLFFCREANRYFEPFCPKCASPLEQCRDDDVLARFHLDAYSTSLKRYLYCPSCGGRSDFYIFEREDSDPADLNDRRALIKDFGQVLSGSKSPPGFPCKECPEQQLCYGDRNEALSRIVPFSFYPFFMLILKPVSLCSTDFLHLLSGAPFDELAERHQRERRGGRAACLRSLSARGEKRVFLFDTGEKHFLEVLYLKLSFLAEISEMVFTGAWEHRYPDPAFTMERLWISMPEQSGYLPSFWNFKTRLIDPVAPLIHPDPFPSDENASREALHFLGRLWFYFMVTNKTQDFAKVAECVSASKALPEPVRGGVFSPGNIFWVPKDPKLTDRSIGAWNRAVDLGFSLLTAGRGMHENWSSEQFRVDLHALRDAVKQALFSEGPGVRPAVRQEQDNAISRIVERVMKRQGVPLPRRGADLFREESDSEWEAKRTIVLSAEELLKAPCSKGEGDESLPRTLTHEILVPKASKEARPAKPVPDPKSKGAHLPLDGADEDDEIEATLTFKGDQS